VRWLRTVEWVFACALLALAGVVARADEPMATRITPDLRVYPQFFSITQDTQRQLYIGGTDGILRHDGGRWIWQPAPKRGAVRALHVDAKNRVWYGGTDSFGYLETLPTGEQRYVDLAPRFAGDLHGQSFADVWGVAEYKGTIWFEALRDVFEVDASGKRLGYWHRPERFGFVGDVRGELWLQWRGEGLRRWNGRDFVPIAGTQMFAKSPIYNIFALADGSVLVRDIASGITLWRDGQATRIDDPALQDDISHLAQGVDLGNGRYAFAGDDGRLRVFDLARRHFESLLVGTGFLGQVTLDRDGALLAIDDQGAVRLPWPPRWSRYGGNDGVTGDLHTLVQVDGRMFLCGSAGVQETKLVDGALATPLQAQRWTHEECWQMLRAGDALLMAESLSLMRIDGDRATPVSANDLYPRALLIDPTDATRLWVGTEHGPVLLQRDGAGFSEIGRVADPGWRVTTLAPAPQGVWMGSDNKGLSLVRVDAKAPHGFTVESWGAQRGLQVGDSGEADVFALPEGMYVSTGRGLFRYVDGRFVKDDFGGLQKLLAADETVQLWAADNSDRWAMSYHTVYRRQKGGPWEVALVGSPVVGTFETLLPLPSGDALIGGAGGVLRFHNNRTASVDSSHPTVRVTAVRLNREGRPPKRLPLDVSPRLEPRGGSVDFDLGFTDFDAGEDKQYQVRVEGFSKGWSDWSRQSSYRFFALPAGDYALRIRARREYDEPVEGQPFRFTIVPRWYERPWAIPLLVLLLSAIVAAALVERQRIRVRRLREHNLELDRLVHARTQDLELMNLRLQDIADRDGLTDIANRRRFDAFLEQCLQRARERKQSLGLAMADVDRFKPYNDVYGHQAGDEVLRRVAKLLAEGVRGDTLVARYGGEEFALIAPGCDLATMRDLAERLRAHVAANLGGITISIGICAFDPAVPETAEELIARADAALYRAKNAGRNRVE
jgi:diguanylate cyclase (GGDEF)-like protein